MASAAAHESELVEAIARTVRRDGLVLVRRAGKLDGFKPVGTTGGSTNTSESTSTDLASQRAARRIAVRGLLIAGTSEG